MAERLKKLERCKCESIDVIWFSQPSSDHVHRYTTVEHLENEAEHDTIVRSSTPLVSTPATDTQEENVRCPVQLGLNNDDQDDCQLNLDNLHSDSKYEYCEDSCFIVREKKAKGLRSIKSRVGSTLGGIIIKLNKSGSKSKQNLKRFNSVYRFHKQNDTEKAVVLQVFKDASSSKSVIIDEAVVIDSFRTLDNVEEISTISSHVQHCLNSVEEETFAPPFCCRTSLNSNELSTVQKFIRMDRGRNQSSIAYEKGLAERTASRICKPEHVKKQVGFKIESDKKSGSFRRTSPKLGEDRNTEKECKIEKSAATKEENFKSNHDVTEQVFHTRNSGLAFSTSSSVCKKPPAGKSEAPSTTTTSAASRRRIVELRQISSVDVDAGQSANPLKKSQIEIRDLKNVIAKLSHEIEDKNNNIASLEASLQTLEERNRQIERVEEKLSEAETVIEGEKERVRELQSELNQMDERYTALKVEFAEKEEKFESYLMNMYKKGLEAARFEREEELEMLAKNNKSNVTVRELTRKLSRTESELARWQGLRLEESYFNSGQPRSEEDATLSFVRDSFLHFMSDTSDIHEHLKALLKIFKYSDEQLGKVWRGLESFKNIDRKKIMDKIEVPNGTKP